MIAGRAQPQTEAETQRLLHELQVRQIELETQYEALRQAHEALEVSLESYTDLYDFAPVGYFTLDRDGVISQVNLTGASLLGVDRARLAGRRLELFVAAVDRPAFSATLQQAFETQAKTVCEVALAKAGGEPLFVRFEALASETRQACRLAAVDLTERQEPKSAEQYRFLVEHLPAGLLVHAADTSVVLSNPKASELLGLSREQMQGKLAGGPGWQFLREDASPMPFEEYPAQRVFATGQPVSYQLLGIRRQTTGDLIWMLAHAYPDFDAQGEVRQTVVMLMDISRRKQTEAALQASESRYRELYRSAQRQAQEMALLDRVRSVVAGELDQAIVMRKVVSAIAELFGYPLVSLYLRQGDVMVLQYQVGYEKVLKEIPVSMGILGKVMRTGQAVLAKDIQTDADFLEAVPGITSEVCAPLFDRGQAVGALNVETRSAAFTEADLRLLTALAEQIGIALGRAWLYTQVREDAATKAILLHEVNHRVKNNLSAIIGLFQLQQDYLPVETKAAPRALFDDLVGRVQSLAAVHDLLSAGAWAPLPIHDLADRIIRAVVALASGGTDIAVDIPPSPVQVTPKQASALALIINELATNSLKHALPQTAPLRLSLRITQEAKLVRLEYRDNGPGFPPDVLGGERHNVGLHLVKLLSRHDLRGKISLSNGPGAVVRLSFGAPGHEALVPAPTGPLSISRPSL